MKNIRLTVWIGMMWQPLVVAGDAPGGRCGSGSYI